MAGLRGCSRRLRWFLSLRRYTRSYRQGDTHVLIVKAIHTFLSSRRYTRSYRQGDTHVCFSCFDPHKLGRSQPQVERPSRVQRRPAGVSSHRWGSTLASITYPKNTTFTATDYTLTSSEYRVTPFTVGVCR